MMLQSNYEIADDGSASESETFKDIDDESSDEQEVDLEFVIKNMTSE